MPTLADTLEQLGSHSQQIHQFSQCNLRPSGPYTTAYLSSAVVPDLIRDGLDAEKRLFKFIGETENNAKKIEKREGLVTPLKEFKAGKSRGGQGEIEVVLSTAARLVDDYRSMPRARAHIANLADAHQRQVARIAELERLIANLDGSVRSSHQAGPASPTPRAKPTLSADEAIKAEDEALKALEASILPHRQAAAAAAYTSPQKDASPLKSPESPISHGGRPSIFLSQTPAKTPAREYPPITNSLVNATTPHRSTKINRFSPLKYIGTPQARERGSIFGIKPPRSALGSRRAPLVSEPVEAEATEGAQLVEQDDEPEDEPEDAGQEDETVRFPVAPAAVEDDGPPSPTPDRSITQEADLQPTPKASPIKLAPPIQGPNIVHGINVDTETTKAAISTISATLSDLLRQGPDDAPASPQETVEHLFRLSISDPEIVPGSDLSTTSTTAGPPAIPLTKETIFQAHLCLLVLKSPTLSLPVNEAKEQLGAALRARRWDEGEAFARGILFKLVGKKTMMIDRRGGGGPSGTLRFN